jgi:hypothetical protein
MTHKKDHKPSTRSWGPFGFVQDIVSPWLGTPPNPALSKELNNKIAQVQGLTRGAAETLDQTFAGGLVKAGVQGNKALAQQAAINAAALGTGYIVGKAAVTAAGAVTKTGVVPRIVNKFLPSQIGVHHSVTQSTGMPFTGTVRPSVANKGLTAMDQKPGYSYFWDTGKGKSGINRAVQEVDFQTKNIADKWLLDPGQTAVGYATKIARGAGKLDTNVPGTIAREVKGTQKIVKTVTASGPVYRGGMTSFSPQDLQQLSKAIQIAKQKELLISAAKIGGTAVGSAVAAKKTKRR